MEITYYWEGDYLIPDLKLSDTIEYHIGKCGRMRQRFLEEKHGGLDIICVSCYRVVKGEQSSPITLKMSMVGFCKKLKSGIDRTKEMGFHRTSCYGLLVSFFIVRMSYRYFLPFSAWLINNRAWKMLYLTSTFSS